MFEGKTCIVTGGSGGIGKEIALELGRNKCNVVVNYFNNSEKANSIVEQIQKLGGKAFAFKCDVSKSEEVKKLVNETVKVFGEINFLVNCAGITKDNFFTNITEKDWDEVIEVNLKGVFNCTNAVLPLMLKNKQGKIVNLASISGQTGNIGQSNYAASKAAVIGFTKSLAREVANVGINVNVVSPGLIKTEMFEKIPKKVVAKFIEATPMKRAGSPKEVADTVLFLLSEKSGFITGQVINVNGGLLM